MIAGFDREDVEFAFPPPGEMNEHRIINGAEDNGARQGEVFTHLHTAGEFEDHLRSENKSVCLKFSDVFHPTVRWGDAQSIYARSLLDPYKPLVVCGVDDSDSHRSTRNRFGFRILPRRARLHNGSWRNFLPQHAGLC